MPAYLQQFYEYAIESQATNHIFMVVLYSAFLFVENLKPGEKSQTANGKWRNVKIGLIRLVLGTFAIYIIVPYLPSYQNNIFPESALGTALYVVVFLLLFDLFFYLYHLAEHRVKWVWPLHELHHSDTELNVTSTFRTHWLEAPVEFMVIVLPCFYLLGMNAMGYVIATSIIVAQLLLTHTNLKIGYGAFGRVLCSPQMHRIHHSILPKHRGKNLCQMFPIFDIIFNTYHHPEKDEYPPTGSHSLATDAKIRYVMRKPVEDWLDLFDKD